MCAAAALSLAAARYSALRGLAPHWISIVSRRPIGRNFKLPGAISHLHLSYAELRDKLSVRASAKVGDPQAAPSDTFLDLYATLVTPAGIGINLLGETWYAQYTAGRGIDEQMILIAANSPYSFLGLDWEHTDIIVPIQLVQGERTIRLSPKQIKTLPFLHAKKAPDLFGTRANLLQGQRRF